MIGCRIAAWVRGMGGAAWYGYEAWVAQRGHEAWVSRYGHEAWVAQTGCYVIEDTDYGINEVNRAIIKYNTETYGENNTIK